MKPHPHIRKSLKWGGLVVTVLLVVVWVVSGWVGVVRFSPSSIINVQAGWIGYSHIKQQNGPVTGIHWIVPKSPGWSFKFAYYDSTGQRAIAIPLWAPVLLSAGVMTAAWRLDRCARRRACLNPCPKCQYDLTGLPRDSAAVCPKCGASPTPRRS